MVALAIPRRTKKETEERLALSRARTQNDGTEPRVITGRSDLSTLLEYEPARVVPGGVPSGIASHLPSSAARAWGTQCYPVLPRAMRETGWKEGLPLPVRRTFPDATCGADLNTSALECYGIEELSTKYIRTITRAVNKFNAPASEASQKWLLEE